jgi:protocatechuate 3,4-dioxygenase alpha subunit
MYFADDALEVDPTLALVDGSRRATLVAERTATRDGGVAYRWDIHLQGERETVFFDA